ncbi:dehydrogenase [Verrucomicrobia bacterium LW23]|nr:dehydrogenase [Verrucomicrobia bacterium LW23]
MRVIVIIKATKNAEQGVMPDQALIHAMDKFNEELNAAGMVLAAEGVRPSSEGKRLYVRHQSGGGEITIVDGPFTPYEELVSGFWIWKVKTMDEALAWAKRCPQPMVGEDAIIEIRPMYEVEDIPAATWKNQ